MKVARPDLKERCPGLYQASTLTDLVAYVSAACPQGIDLSVKNMVKNHCLAKSINDAAEPAASAFALGVVEASGISLGSGLNTFLVNTDVSISL